jgi:hypothetical protein
MLFVDVLYVGAATVLVMALLHVLMYVGIQLTHPPAPKVIYVPTPVPQPAPVVQQQLFPPTTAIPPPQIPPQFVQPPPALTERKEEVQLPEYEPRSTPSSTSLRLDSGLPDGLQETRPPGI